MNGLAYRHLHDAISYLVHFNYRYIENIIAKKLFLHKILHITEKRKVVCMAIYYNRGIREDTSQYICKKSINYFNERGI